MKTNSSYERGAIGTAVIVAIGTGILAVLFAVLAVWAYANYLDQKDNVDAKVSNAVATAQKEQADQLEKKFAEREKDPYRSFASPADFGTLGFKYPKTWSVYVSNDGSDGGTYQAYLNPVVVPSTQSQAARYALRVSILDQKYENVIAAYKEKVKSGQLKTSAVKASGQNGTRLDGSFSEDIRGAAVIFKIRDKTAVLRTDADTFMADFNTLVPTINFIQ
jgi:hypothetical protein